MIQETVLRLKDIGGGLTIKPPVVIGAAAHRDLILDQLSAVGIEASLVVLEPQARNTAATAALAAFAVDEVDPKAVALLLPADHVIGDVTAFGAVLKRSLSLADERIVTFGIEPNRPETGYGYIEAGQPLAPGVFAIARFHEKPTLDIAKGYVESTGFSWNAGMFMFRPGTMLEEFSQSASAIRDAVSMAWFGGKRERGVVLLDAEAFAKAPAAPVDIAIMEKTQRGAVAPVSMQWADVGAWSEVWRIAEKDESGNVIDGPVIDLGVNDCLVRADGVPVAIAGVSDVIVVATRDGVLVVSKDRAQDVKPLLEALKTRAS